MSTIVFWCLSSANMYHLSMSFVFHLAITFSIVSCVFFSLFSLSAHFLFGYWRRRRIRFGKKIAICDVWIRILRINMLTRYLLRRTSRRENNEQVGISMICVSNCNCHLYIVSWRVVYAIGTQINDTNKNTVSFSTEFDFFFFSRIPFAYCLTKIYWFHLNRKESFENFASIEKPAKIFNC